MTITAQDARDEYTATAGQTVFNYTFKIYEATELDVYITPTGQEANDSADLTTAYTVDPLTIGNPNGGFITLNSGANSGDLVTIVSGMPYDRTVDYQNSGDFLPDTVNGDNDRQVSQIKQVADLANRSLLFPQSLQNASSLDLPLPVAGFYLRWKSDLSGLENTGAPGVVLPSEINGTASDMVADTSLQIGDFVTTTGYGVEGDGGDNTYEIVAGATSIDDGGSYIDLANGLQAMGTFPGGVINAKQFGAVGDGATDDRAKILNADAFGPITFTEGSYRLSADTVLSNDVAFLGGAHLLVDYYPVPNSLYVTFSDTQGVVRASWFGATGGGVVNEVPFLQAALDAASGGHLHIDDGLYLLGTALEIDSDTELTLSRSATIRRNSTTDNMLRNKADGLTGGYGANNNIHVTGGIWDANRANYPTNITIIAFGHCRNVSVSDADMKGVESWHCIEFNAVLEGRIDNCRFTLCDRILTAEAVQLDIMLAAGNFLGLARMTTQLALTY